MSKEEVLPITRQCQLLDLARSSYFYMPEPVSDEELEEAIEQYGCPEIFNTDQGSQFTSEDFTSVLKKNHIKISMDGKGRWVDNVFVERLWRSVKYEEVYLNAYDSVADARYSLG